MSNVRIAVIDYGMGNLRSVEKACIHAGFDACVTDSPRKIDDATHVILPGVGAVGDALQRLREKGLFDCASAQAKKGKPFLGICLGMQMLFTKSFEFGEHDCLGLVPGRVVPFQIEERVPHIGWNDIKVHQRNPAARRTKWRICVFRTLLLCRQRSGGICDCHIVLRT